MHKSYKLIDINKRNLNSIPELTGVYIFWSGLKIPLYVGKSINLKSRVNSYFLVGVIGKTKKMINEARFFSYIEVPSELEALLLEAKLVRNFNPYFNIELKDDKHPLYIKITGDDYPRVITVRKDETGGTTYGPFPSSTSVISVLKMIRRVIPYSDHKLGRRPCLYSQIGLCNPCPSAIVQNKGAEAKIALTKKYLQNIKMIKKLLDGNIGKLKRDLGKVMTRLSSEDKYEEAIAVRAQIARLNYITQPIKDVSQYLDNPNLFSDIKEEEMASLQKILLENGQNTKSLKRIECYDVAHIAGTNPAASMVTFIDGIHEKKYYRHFKIRQAEGNNDISSLTEVAERRVKHFDDWGKPDLVVVDGGKGQVSAFFSIFEAFGIPVVGLAKREETLVIPSVNGNLKFKLIKLKIGAALNLMQSIRNEAHRFARRYHHRLVEKVLIPDKLN